MLENWQVNGFGIYVHWPFCQSKCPYCDFNSHVWTKIDHSQWKSAYLQELRRNSYHTKDRVVRSVYFGGGTPSLMNADTVGAILDEISSLWSISNDVEITLEANPGSVERARFHAFRQAGVNRVSVGIQALNDQDLHKLGRLHSVAEAKAALATANDVFDRVNFDLIYARQDQNLEQWHRELTEALAFGPTHLSLYQLTIEPGTAFADRLQAGGLRGLPDEDLSADMFELTQAMTSDVGLPAYEVSNHAQKGQESVHNQIYWNGGDWLGIGPGAHGRLTQGGQRIATETPLSPAVWLEEIRNGRSPESKQMLTATDAAKEFLMMGLRTINGVGLDRLGCLGPDFSKAYRDYVESGFLTHSNGTLIATDKGRPLLNAILRNIMPD